MSHTYHSRMPCSSMHTTTLVTHQQHQQHQVLTKLQKWGDYAAYGEPLGPTRFIPMKTPLSEDILAHWTLPTAPRHRLTVHDLLAAQRAAGRNVGMILDLSNHECLYTADLPPGLHYEHIYLVAKELPPRDFVDKVCEVADSFWARHPDLYICVHCAYGRWGVGGGGWLGRGGGGWPG